MSKGNERVEGRRSSEKKGRERRRGGRETETNSRWEVTAVVMKNWDEGKAEDAIRSVGERRRVGVRTSERGKVSGITHLGSISPRPSVRHREKSRSSVPDDELGRTKGAKKKG